MASGHQSVAQSIARALQRHGVEVIFGQSLPSAVILACEAIGIRQLAYRQENMGGAMADGYARRSGKVAVVAAQNGPAATLLVPPLAEALKASIPIVALVQEVERAQADRNAFQELDHIALFSGCAKWTRRIVTPDRAEDYVDQAFVAAASGRPGPAVLLLPADLLRSPVVPSAASRTKNLGFWPLDRIRPADALIEVAADMLATAQRPVVIAGGGALGTGGPEALARLQEQAHLPVFTTNMGKGAVSELHPLSCGVLGSLTGPRSLGRHTRSLLDDADVVLLVGTRNNQNGTNSWRLLPPAAKIIHIDIDPNEIGRNYEAVRLVGDAADHARRARPRACRAGPVAPRCAGAARCEQRIASAWQTLRQRPPPAHPSQCWPDPARARDGRAAAVAHARDDRGRGRQLFVDVGRGSAARARARHAIPHAARPCRPRLGPAARDRRKGRGPAAARWSRWSGDGGFAHSWAELETAVRSRLAVTVILLNNGVLGYQKDAETVKFGAYTTACNFAPVDHAAIARACGCEGIRVDDVSALRPTLETAVRSDKPWLIEVMTDPEAHPPLSLYDGTLDHAEAPVAVQSSGVLRGEEHAVSP